MYTVRNNFNNLKHINVSKCTSTMSLKPHQSRFSVLQGGTEMM